MTAQIITPQATYPLDTSCKTVLEAIQMAGIDFAAPCGGKGTCKKCDVLVRDEQGLRSELSCMIAPTENMVIQLEEAQAMTISEAGMTSSFDVDIAHVGFGFSIDVGTTTVVMRLIDLTTGTCLATTSRPNPQVAFGADVLARISAAIDGKLRAMEKLIVSTLGDMAADLLAKCELDASAITGATLAANTVMESIAAGVDPAPIGISPFIPITYFGYDVNIPGLCEHTYFIQSLSGYVGGDITADIVAERIIESPKLRLLLDLGTNGEMALGNQNRLLTCATAAGPVFEGANIVYGMPARMGAISRVELVNDDIAITTIGDIEAFGICGTGIIDAVAVLLEAGIVDETGYLLDADELESNISPALAARVEEHNGSNAFRLTDDVYLTQADIRNVQLAKSAICAGILTLADKFGSQLADIDELLIAGGFGSFLNIETSARIGLFPECLASRAKSIGNASVEGATAIMINTHARKQERAVAELDEYVELSTSAAFNQFYVECMMFPEVD